MYMFKKIEPTEIGYLAFLFLKPIMNKHKWLKALDFEKNVRSGVSMRKGRDRIVIYFQNLSQNKDIKLFSNFLNYTKL